MKYILMAVAFLMVAASAQADCREVCQTVCDSPTPTVSPSPAPTSTPVITASPRGVSLLESTFYKARASAATKIFALKAAELPRPAMSFIVSGTFGKDDDYVVEAVKSVKTPVNYPYVVLYYQSGPSQRRYTSKFFYGIGDQTAPATWNKQLQSDPKVRQQFIDHLKSLVPLINRLLALGAEVQLGALEDNYDDATMRAVEAMIKTVNFPQDVRMFRSTVATKGYVPPNWNVDRHGNWPAVCQRSGDMWSNDGYSFDHNMLEGIPYFNQCDAVKGAALFHIQKTQGVQVNVPFKPVDQRVYSPLTTDEQVQLVKALKSTPFVPSAGLLRVCKGGFIPVQLPTLYKESSDHTGGTREGRPALLAYDQFAIKGTVNAYNAEGATVAKFGHYGDYLTKWERWYTGWRNGTMDTKEQLSAKGAPLFIQASGGRCFGPIYDPKYRQGAVK